MPRVLVTAGPSPLRHTCPHCPWAFPGGFRRWKIKSKWPRLDKVARVDKVDRVGTVDKIDRVARVDNVDKVDRVHNAHKVHKGREG